MAAYQISSKSVHLFLSSNAHILVVRYDLPMYICSVQRAHNKEMRLNLNISFSLMHQ
jgi:hypothetical protein